ncbi:MAG TPA: hypothetical protein VN043_14775 [Rhodanobacter sp.]|nr:hypothetical protein [Rhodanobacter sp.]
MPAHVAALVIGGFAVAARCPNRTVSRIVAVTSVRGGVTGGRNAATDGAASTRALRDAAMPDLATSVPHRIPAGCVDADAVRHPLCTGRHTTRDGIAGARDPAPIIHRDAAVPAARIVPCACRPPS